MVMCCRVQSVSSFGRIGLVLPPAGRSSSSVNSDLQQGFERHSCRDVRARLLETCRIGTVKTDCDKRRLLDQECIDEVYATYQKWSGEVDIWLYAYNSPGEFNGWTEQFQPYNVVSDCVQNLKWVVRAKNPLSPPRSTGLPSFYVVFEASTAVNWVDTKVLQLEVQLAYLLAVQRKRQKNPRLAITDVVALCGWAVPTAFKIKKKDVMDRVSNSNYPMLLTMMDAGRVIHSQTGISRSARSFGLVDQLFLLSEHASARVEALEAELANLKKHIGLEE
jgi:hypothetical protein